MKPGEHGTDSDSVDAVVAGCIGIDTNVYLYGADIDWTVEANFTQNLDYVGQAGGYASRAFARLGLRTLFLGAVGNDWQGAEVRRALAADGIRALLFDDPQGTHRSINFMYRDGRRKNFYDGKGQMDVRPDLARCRTALRGARVLHAHLENWCRDLLPVARDEGLVVSVDLQDVIALDDPYRRDFVQCAEVIFFSCVNWPDPRPAVEFFLRAPHARVVIGGRGAEGVVVGTREGIRVVPPAKLPEPVVDTNGAGDALATGFLAAHVVDGRPVDEAVARGQLAARWCCTRRADSGSLITRAELDALVP